MGLFGKKVPSCFCDNKGTEAIKILVNHEKFELEMGANPQPITAYTGVLGAFQFGWLQPYLEGAGPEIEEESGMRGDTRWLLLGR